MRTEDARGEVLRAALRCFQAELSEEHANADAEAQYAQEGLALAARDLTRATDVLPPDMQPVGWRDGGR